MYADMLQVRSNEAIVYRLWLGARKAQNNIKSLLNLQKAKYSGQVTSTSEKNIRRAVDLLLQASARQVIWNPVVNCFHGFQLGFLTLTVSCRRIFTHKEVYKSCFKAMLEWLRRRGCLYVWKAELQERGQIHYHLTINQFISLFELKKEWNKLQRKAGYLSGFAARQGHFNPNSIDIHSVKNVRDIEAYLVKYISKKDSQGRTIAGKIWGCSKTLSGKRFSVEMDADTDQKARAVAVKRELAQCTILKKSGAKLLSRFGDVQYKLFIQNLKS